MSFNLFHLAGIGAMHIQFSESARFFLSGYEQRRHVHSEYEPESIFELARCLFKIKKVVYVSFLVLKKSARVPEWLLFLLEVEGRQKLKPFQTISVAWCQKYPSWTRFSWFDSCTTATHVSLAAGIQAPCYKNVRRYLAWLCLRTNVIHIPWKSY